MTEGKVLWHVTMSLDGFTAGPDDTMDWLSGYGSRRAMADEVMARTGAILAGRRWYDVATSKYGGRGGIYGGAGRGPVFVRTHNPPAAPGGGAAGVGALRNGRGAAGDGDPIDVGRRARSVCNGRDGAATDLVMGG